MLRGSGAVFVVLMTVLALGVGCGGDKKSAADAGPDAAPPTGTINLSWHLTQNAATVTCSDVGATLVNLALLRDGAGAGEADSGTCSAMMLTTHRLAVGSYQVTIDLVDSGSNSLLAAPVVKNGVQVTADGDTPLGDIELAVP